MKLKRQLETRKALNERDGKGRKRRNKDKQIIAEAEVRIWGTEGEAIIDYHQEGGLRYHLAEDNTWTTLTFDTPNRFVQQAAHFLECVRTGGQPQVGGEDDIAVMRVIEAAYASARR